MEKIIWEQFPDERGSGKTILEQIHKVEVRMLRIFDAICKKYDIDYWLDYGTLLGAIRHQGFIPWDTDIDIGILRADYNLFLEKGVKDLPFDIFFQTEDTDPNIQRWGNIVEARLRDRFSDGTSTRENPNYTPVNWQNGLQVDFFVYDYDATNNRISNRFERLLNQGKIYIELDEIENLDTAVFEGDQYDIPAGYNSYLKRCYGNYMQLPSKEEQDKIPNVSIFSSYNHPESLNWEV